LTRWKIVEGSGRPELEAAVVEIDRAVADAGCGLTAPETLVYNLAYRLGPRSRRRVTAAGSPRQRITNSA
jgi:hypothetical protein